MNTNNYFSFSRLGLVMKRDFVENWKTNLYVFLGIFLAFLSVYLFNMLEYESRPSKGITFYVFDHAEGFMVIFIFLLLYFASITTNNMRTKEARIAYLMLPATSLEKFVSRVLYATVGVFVMILGASLLAEAVHWAFMPFFDEMPDKFKVCVWPEVWGKIWNAINPFQTKNVYLNVSVGSDPSTWQHVEKRQFFIYLMGYAAFLWKHSIFVLGGNYFGKHPFLKTIGTMILVAILIAWPCTYIDWDDLKWIYDFLEDNKYWLTEDIVAGFVSFIFFAFTIFNWWLSYKLFTRQQVIKPKFRLL